jgi:hypothetical protein
MAMTKQQARKELGETRTEIENLEGQLTDARNAVREISERIERLRHVERYFAEQAGEKPSRPIVSSVGARRGIAEEAAAIMAPGEVLKGAELARRMLANGFIYSGTLAKLSQTFSTVLVRDPRFTRAGYGTWRRNED